VWNLVCGLRSSAAVLDTTIAIIKELRARSSGANEVTQQLLNNAQKFIEDVYKEAYVTLAAYAVHGRPTISKLRAPDLLHGPTVALTPTDSSPAVPPSPRVPLLQAGMWPSLQYPRTTPILKDPLGLRIEEQNPLETNSKLASRYEVLGCWHLAERALILPD
jgi:hypothetical protein